MPFPIKKWEQMTEPERDHFRNLGEAEVISRWNTPAGKALMKEIIDRNLKGGAVQYDDLVGTVKVDWGTKSPKLDLRGINLSSFSNLINDEYFAFDFRNCLLHYSDFSMAVLTTSDFSSSDILYSDFSNSSLWDCDFSNSNLTLSKFDGCFLENANFNNAWLSEISLDKADLSFLKFNAGTDFQNIDINKVTGASNPLFISFVKRKQYLKHFKAHSFPNKLIYYAWKLISDNGQSFFRWASFSIIICGFFGFLYSLHPLAFKVSDGRPPTPFTFYYFSTVTFTTLGFGDVTPISLRAEIAVTAEVILGYLMLGGLISIFATKFIPKD